LVYAKGVFMTEKPQTKMDIDHEVNLQSISKVREDVPRNPQTQAVVIIQRNEDASIFTTADEENVLLSFSS
jgi:hypothetical protein